MKAEIINIGTELLIGHVINSNAAFLSEQLNSLGISVLYHTVVGDNPERVKSSLRQAQLRSDLVIVTGGLGPTDDDITHDTISDFLEAKMFIDDEEKKILEQKFYSTGRKEIPEINYRQARLIEEAEVIPNPIGTAIGWFVNRKDLTVISFPGVPIEMEAMFKLIIPKLKAMLIERGEAAVIASRCIRMTNITESRMAQMIIDHFKSKGEDNPFLHANPSLAPYATLGECYLRITALAQTEEEAKSLMTQLDEDLHGIFADYIYGYDEDTIHGLLAKNLIERKLSLSFAESCTGGLLSKIMTDIPGASNYTKLNLVTYSNEAKMQMLQVKEETLKQYGAVSRECAREMALGLSDISDAEINVSITGIAGPDGDSEEKPICFQPKLADEILSKHPDKEIESLPDGKGVYVDKLNWIARRLSREEVRELATKKTFYRIYGFIK